MVSGWDYNAEEEMPPKIEEEVPPKIEEEGPPKIEIRKKYEEISRPLWWTLGS